MLKCEREFKTRQKRRQNREAGTVYLCTHTTGQYNINKEIVDIEFGFHEEIGSDDAQQQG